MQAQSNISKKENAPKQFTISITDLITKVETLGLDKFKYKSFSFEKDDKYLFYLNARVGISNFWKWYDIFVLIPLFIPLVISIIAFFMDQFKSDGFSAVLIGYIFVYWMTLIDSCLTNMNRFSVALYVFIITYSLLLPILFIISVITFVTSIGKKAYCFIDSEDVAFFFSRKPKTRDKNISKYPTKSCKIGLKKNTLFCYTMFLSVNDAEYVISDNISRKDAQNFIKMLDMTNQ